MKTSKRFLAFLLAFCLLLGGVPAVLAAPEDDTVTTAATTYEELAANLLYYQYQGWTTDVLIALDTMKTDYPTYYDMWESVISFWSEQNTLIGTTRANVNTEAPDDLPTSGHAFVVLGYQLASDGTAQAELIGRLTTALEAANKYPNSYVVVTGGAVTNGFTEGAVMKAWLLANGLDESRIILEDASNDTAQNARNTLALLYASYPDITSMTVITSDYHVRRGLVLYKGASEVMALSLGKTAIELVGHVGYTTTKTMETLGTMTSQLASIASVSSSYSGASSRLSGTRAVLEDIAVTAPTKSSYTLGQDLDLSGLAVTSSYVDKTLTRDVTALATVSGFDSSTAGTKTVTVTYVENSVTKTATFAVTVVDTVLSTLIADLLYYQYQGWDTDVLIALDTMKTAYPDYYDTWESIISFWSEQNAIIGTTRANIGTEAPDDLPTSGHAFVVLGYQLASDGTAQDELIGRLTTALAAANKYPNSYVVVTGGAVTNGFTEGAVMKAWLIANGLDESRIILEERSNNTAQNALNTMELLYASYPDITTMTVITSDYHVRRGLVLYQGASEVMALDLGKTAIELVGHVGFTTTKTMETLGTMTQQLASIAGVSTQYSGASGRLSGTRAVLEDIAITAPTKSSYTTGQDLDISGLAVTSSYVDKTFTRDVTALATVTGFDNSTAGTQTVTVTYVENSITKTATFDVTVTYGVLESLIADLIYFKQNGWDTDVLIALDTMKQEFPDAYAIWQPVITYWDELDANMVINTTVPADLPTANHAFVVLGYALNADGTMQDELVGRLTTALAAATAYPNSYVMVTGGAEKSGVREADAMKAWLVANGLSEERIIVENNSNTTVENAKYTMDILYSGTYNITAITTITSTYHLRRAQILYYYASLMEADEQGATPIKLIGNVGFTAEGMDNAMIIAYSLAGLADVMNEYMAVNSNPPTRAVLEDIAITAPTKSTYTIGQDLDISGLAVTSSYVDKTFTRDVTALATVTGFDSSTAGTQTVTVTYVEDSITKTATFDVTVTENVKLPFTDVSEGSWYYNAVEYTYTNGLIAGVSGTKFAPQTKMTREMFVTVLARLAKNMGEDITGYTNKFTDVPKGMWYSDAIAWGAAKGLVGGYDAKTFGLGDNVTREQMAAFLVRFAKYMEIELGTSKTVTYTDASSISKWAKSDVTAATAAGLFVGDNGKFYPQRNSTRAEAAQVFMQFCKLYVG